MAFEKSFALMRLAEMAAARHKGVCLLDVMEEFEVNQRTAQRMVRGLELIFPSVITSTDDDRRRWWKLKDPTFLRHQGIRDSELLALDMSIRRARREGAELDVKALASLRDRLLASLPSSQARRAEVDAGAMLEAQGFACRPGPRSKVAPNVLGAIAEAIKAPFCLDIIYQSAKDPEPKSRHVEPYGVLLGVRQYLVARDIANKRAFRRYRIDRVTSAKIIGSSFVRDPDFDLDAFAIKAFGSFHSKAEFGPVVWRFAPSAAATAKEFEFHPTQKMVDEPDGSLLVQFTASGWVEMAWHLMSWGNAVEVLEPPELIAILEQVRRSTVDVLP
ncbi:WYL domain-containing protein [Seohaeicola saemankumensis]|uniref:helix-turn-helix transcriptional regulator n=1 Tax=Seohaeicola TaxID=481178 RepID=UPI0035CFB046